MWGRLLIATALLGGISMIWTRLGRDALSRARTGARIVKNRSTEVEVLRDLPYRTVDGQTLTLDLYRPKETEAPLPGIVMIHGGSWRSGSKEQVAEVAKPVAQQGYVVASINYRLAPRWTFPAPVEDSKAAVRWMRRNAAQYDINPAKIGAVGFSAGAQLAALLGTTGDSAYRDGTADGTSARVQAVVAVSGPYDFYRFEKLPDETWLSFYFGGTYREKPQLYREASPILRASHDSAPFLLLSGDEDTLVLPENDDLLAAALKRNGVEADVIHVKNAEHVLKPVSGRQIDPPFPLILLRVADFLHNHLG